MECLESRNLLQRRLDERRLDGDALVCSAELEQHLAQCPGCRVLHASGELLLKGLQALPAVVPVDFSRLAGLVMEDNLARRRRVRLRLVVTTALAAAVLIMALAGEFLLPIPRNTRPDPSANERRKETPPLGVDKAPALAESVVGARQAFASLSERWGDMAKEQTKILLSAANPMEFTGIDNLPDLAKPLQLEPAAQALQQAGQDVAESLQPVAASPRRAVAYFFRELPVLDGNH